MNQRPIGVFDSGVGGLTVVRSLMRRLPAEHFLYLGDDARGPYGPRDLEEVRRFALEITEYLIGFGVKLVVIACNTATAAALEQARQVFRIPVTGVIIPAVRAAVELSRVHRVGVIGTSGTIGSGEYQRALGELAPGFRVFARACPEFVEFVERKEFYGERIHAIAAGHLAPLIEADIDTLIMGCTHYPLLEDLLLEVAGPGINLVSSAEATAAEVEHVLGYLGWLNEDRQSGSLHLMTTGDVERFKDLSLVFLGPEVQRVTGTSLDERPVLDHKKPSLPS